jgi:uncharacterized membrane protein YhaH (DUF805 family)
LVSKFDSTPIQQKSFKFSQILHTYFLLYYIAEMWTTLFISTKRIRSIHEDGARGGDFVFFFFLAWTRSIHEHFALFILSSDNNSESTIK